MAHTPTRSTTAISRTIKRLAVAIDAPAWALPTYSASRGDATPRIERQGDEYLYIIEERGEEYERRHTTDREELLFWVFDDITFALASTWAAHHPVEGEDFRKGMWERQFELLGRLNSSWPGRARVRIGDRLLREASVSPSLT